jgi:hypothetical protein
VSLAERNHSPAPAEHELGHDRELPVRGEHVRAISVEGELDARVSPWREGEGALRDERALCACEEGEAELAGLRLLAPHLSLHVATHLMDGEESRHAGERGSPAIGACFGCVRGAC